MGKKIAKKVAESDSDMGFDDDMEYANMSVESDKELENGHELKDDETEDEDHDTDENGSGDDEEEEGENENEQKAVEMDELEKEYLQLRHEEQDILRNLKRSSDEDLQKGHAVKNQRALWDKTLELRFLLQKGFSSSNRLPQEPARSLFCETDAGVSEAYSDLIDSSKKTLDSILELQQALIDNNPSIIPSSNGTSLRDSKQSQSAASLSSDIDDEWQQISQMQSRMVSYRNKSIDKWHRKTQVTTGAAAIKDKLHAFNQSISEQVATYMRDPSKMIKGMQQNKSLVAVFGNVPNSTDNNNNNPDETFVDGDPELLDDSELYQQLLKEFFEAIDPSSSEAAFYALKRLQTKKRKIVDRRASKSRKIRYHVHEKIVNFMAPRPMNVPPMAPKLFEDLFGLKSQKA